MRDRTTAPCTRNQPRRTAPLLTDATRRIRITHPFHPLSGREYRLVEYRRDWGREQAVFRDANDELFAVPVDWTDLTEGADAFVTLSEGRAFSRPSDLLALSALIEEVNAS
jgi:hypothetical protein